MRNAALKTLMYLLTTSFALPASAGNVTPSGLNAMPAAAWPQSHDQRIADRSPSFQTAQARPRRAAPQAETYATPAGYGTPQGTAQIAASAGFLEMVDIKLGTPEKDAVAALKRHNPALTLTPYRLMTYVAMPNVSMTPVIVAETKPGPDFHFERFSLELTYSPNDAFVWGISREYSFAKGQAPTFENTVASFQKKYGPSSFMLTNEQPVWVFDAQGKLVPGQKARDILYKCPNQWQSNVSGISAGGNRPTHDNRLSNSWYDQQLRGGYYFSQHGRDTANGACHSHALVHLGLQRMSAMPGQPTNLIRGFVVRVSNRQLEASGVEASHKQLFDAVKAAEQKEAGAAAKRSGPKL